MQRKIRDVDCVIEVGFPKSNLMNRCPGSWCQNTIQWEESNFPWRGWRSKTPSSRPQQSRSDPWVWQRSHQKGVDETESTHIKSALYQLQDLLLSGNGGHHPHSVQTCWCRGQVFVTWLDLCIKTKTFGFKSRWHRAERPDSTLLVIGIPNVGKSSLINKLRSDHLKVLFHLWPSLPSWTRWEEDLPQLGLSQGGQSQHQSEYG